jgi:hypothetical protein
VRSRRCNGDPGFREKQRGDELDGILHPRPAAIYSGESSCPAAAPPCLGDGEFPGDVREVGRNKWPAPESTRDPEGFL